jgi:hypothetical protein
MGPPSLWPLARSPFRFCTSQAAAFDEVGEVFEAAHDGDGAGGSAVSGLHVAAELSDAAGHLCEGDVVAELEGWLGLGRVGLAPQDHRLDLLARVDDAGRCLRVEARVMLDVLGARSHGGGEDRPAVEGVERLKLRGLDVAGASLPGTEKILDPPPQGIVPYGAGGVLGRVDLVCGR